MSPSSSMRQVKNARSRISSSSSCVVVSSMMGLNGSGVSISDLLLMR